MTKKGSILHNFKCINLDIDYEISDCYYGDEFTGTDFEITAVRVDGSDVDIMALLTGEQSPSHSQRNLIMILWISLSNEKIEVLNKPETSCKMPEMWVDNAPCGYVYVGF